MTQTKSRLTILLLLLAAGLTAAGAAASQPLAGEPSRTLSPYFHVHSEDPEVHELPLESTRVETRIAGVIADVRVEQVYRNGGQRPLEAIYVFPASTRAAVHGMKMTIGDRTIVAEVREREQARREYEEARDEGRNASLLEQQRSNVFQMNVANIMPGDRIVVELLYTELLLPTEGVYEFVYPTVVGPRYSNQAAESAPQSDQWIANPYLREGEAPTYTFDMRVELNGGVPVQDVACASHQVEVAYSRPDRAVIELASGPGSGGNRDFVLRYRLQGQQIQSGLLLHEGDDESFFLLTVQPPERIEPASIPPREFVFVVDVSGSMNGFPLDTAKGLMRRLLDGLRPVDRFNLVLFAGGSKVLARRSLAASPANVTEAMATLDRERGGGGTELLPALQRAVGLPRDQETARTVLVITDGFVGVEVETFELIRDRLGEANLFAFGIGTSVNRLLIEGMARAGMGEAFVVTSAAEAAAKSGRFYRYVATPVLTGVELTFDGLETYDVVPARVPDVLAERPLTVFGKWRGRPRGTIRLRGRQGDREYQDQIVVNAPDSSGSNPALRYLWARHRIAELGDDVRIDGDADTRDRIVRLGLEYNLLTDYTSFVGIDREVRRDGSEVVTTVRQPLPLPEGVGDLALGGGARMMKAAAPTFSLARSVLGALGGAGRMAAPETECELVEEEPEPELRVLRIEVSDGLGAREVERLLVDQLQDMVDQLRGREVELRFEIDAAGRAGSLALTPHDLPAAIRDGIEELLAGLRFPASTGASTASVRLRFRVD